MTWTVTLHPALTGDVADMATADQTALIEQLLRLELDGGRAGVNAGYPPNLPNDQIWNFRFNFLMSPDCMIALSGSWVQHEVCVLGLTTSSTESNAASYNEWGDLILARYGRLQKNDVEALDLQRFLEIFPPEQVDIASHRLWREQRHKNRADAIELAAGDMRQEMSDLFNLDKRHQRRLERRCDFMLDRLREKLAQIKGQVTLQVKFEDESFEFDTFRQLLGTDYKKK